MENIFNYKIVTDGSMTTDITSEVVDLSLANGYAIQAWFTGSPVGSLKLEASNDGIQWTDISDSITAVSAAGTLIWKEDSAMYDKVRAVYTFSSGSGTLNIQINGKGNTY